LPEEIDLKEIERKSYLSYHQDGLVDVFLGLAAVYIAAVFWFVPDVFFIFTAAIGMWMFFYLGAKKALTVPRLGYVEFSSQRQTKVMLILGYITLLNVISFVLAMYAWLIDSSFFLLIEANGLLVIGVIVASVFAVGGYGTGIQRFYIYGLVTLLAFSAGQIFLIHFALPVLVLGVVMVSVGAILLARFLRKYPKPTGGEELDARFATL
jgi:hypothetical protein